MTLHFHVDEHDAGYMPESDVEWHKTSREALDAVIEHLDRHAEFYAQMEPTDQVRGNAYSEWTAAQELAATETEIERLRGHAENPDWMADFSRLGYLAVLENGVRVVDAGPCADACPIPEYT